MGRGTVATLKRDEIKGASDVRKMFSADKYRKTSSRETGTSNCFYFPGVFSGTLPFKIEGGEDDIYDHIANICVEKCSCLKNLNSTSSILSLICAGMEINHFNTSGGKNNLH